MDLIEEFRNLAINGILPNDFRNPSIPESPNLAQIDLDSDQKVDAY